MTIYPERTAIKLIGRRAPRINEALECFGALLKPATLNVSGIFHPDQWKEMAAVFKDLKLDAGVSKPALVMSSLVQGRLRELIEELDYLQCWAILFAVRWSHDHAGKIRNGDPWWTIKFRSEH